MTTIPGTARQRGFALLIVLWTMALLALIGTGITATGHTEAQLATNLRANAIAEAAADGAVFEAVFHFMDGSAGHWPADGLAHRVEMPQAQVAVTLVDESSKISLNNAPPPLLRDLLRALGVNQELAAVLTDQIVDWRSGSPRPHSLGAEGPQYKAAGRDWGPPNEPFRTVNELGMVLSMTPGILDRLRPYLSPYTYSTPNPDVAEPVVRAVLAEVAAKGSLSLGFDVQPTLTITASALSAGGGRFTRRAVIRLNSNAAANPDLPQFFVLDWHQATK
jgi:general secretion pathway protein K